MKIESETAVPFDARRVYSTLRDRLSEVGARLPNISRIEVEARRKEGKRLRVVNVWYADVEIPAPARPFVPKDLLRWRDHALWDDARHLVDWRLEPFVFPGLFECAGTNSVLADGPGRSRVRISGEMEVHPEVLPGVPRLFAGMVRPHVERMVARAISPNMTRLAHALSEFLAEEDATAGRTRSRKGRRRAPPR